MNINNERKATGARLKRYFEVFNVFKDHDAILCGDEYEVLLTDEC